MASHSTRDIQPGLMVVHGNQLEDLRDLLIEWLARAPLAPLENEVMLVQSNGIAQWLKLALARPRDAGGMGISAAVDMQLPGRFLWQACRAVLGHDAVPVDSPYDKSRLVWRLMRLLPTLLDQPAFAPLRHFVGSGRPDAVKLWQLAQQVADLYDQYQVYRADWLEDWEAGRDQLRDELRARTAPLPPDQRWQALLWRALLADVGPQERHHHRAAVHAAFLARAAQLSTRPAGLPRRITVFGISSLPQQTLEALTALGRVCQILLLVSNPCRYYWGDIIEDRELLKAAHRRQAGKAGQPDEPRLEDLHLHANPLLAAWGKQGRDYIRLLDSFDTPDAYRTRFAALGRDIDLFTPPGADTLLHQVQQAIFNLEPLPADHAQRQPLIPGDDSLRFHVAHTAQREVEILHDNLLALFEQAARAGTPLMPRDVMVMVPDIATYAPHIEAAFGRLPATDPRCLPCTIADRPARGSTSLLVALERLLHLPESRCSAGDVLDLLDTPALRRRFQLDATALPVLRRWIEGAGIRWGLDGAQKQTLGLPPEEQNTWRFGLRRMLLGYAVGAGETLAGIAPYDEVGGLDAALVGPLAWLVDALDQCGKMLATPATPASWCERLHGLLNTFFDAGRDDADAALLQRLHDALDDWQEGAQGEPGRSPGAAARAPDITKGDPASLVLPIEVVREWWLAAMDESRLSQRFLGGAVSFGTLLPMRAIPFRVVCLLGMNDGAYPRRGDAPDFDLMATPGQQRPGDRSRREDDRYLFLEALLAARETLYVSWIGRNARDNGALPPSVLVGQLRDYLAAGWKAGSGNLSDAPPQAGNTAQDAADPLPLLTTEYPLQAFSASYFDAASPARWFTYAHEWQRARHGHAADDGHPLPMRPREAPITLALLQRFLKCPARVFYAERLGVHFAAAWDDDADDEPFALDGLQAHQFGDALLQAALRDGAAAIAPAAQTLRERGELPPGSSAHLALAPIEQKVHAVAAAWYRLAQAHPGASGTCTLHLAHAGLVLEDTLGGLRGAGDDRVQLIATVSSLGNHDNFHHEKLIGPWVSHLLANACGAAVTTQVVAATHVVRFDRMEAAAARQQADALLAAFAAGLATPLPIARGTACAWLDAARDPSRDAAKRYNHADGGYGHGEVDDEPALARHWPDFAALHAAGFETWLHLYQPMIDAAHVTEHGA